MNRKRNYSNEEPRYEGTDWDPVATVKQKGPSCRTVSRKVKTKGVRYFDGSPLMGDVITRLRQGYEVRICTARDMESAAIRLFPCLDADCRTMHVTAQAMGEFRTETLADKHAVVRIGGAAAKRAEVERYIDRAEIRYAKRRASMVCVTPDTTVTCPSCGSTFRVGRQLTDRK